ncbi:hypothetical protein BJ999_004392 [Actinomadura citrea]|uniref:Tn3 transposase DDE domain-containing protein n=1 Tax=Actinomadura citrea TaxID=46158 RepID=A0A7Y9GCY1_9ACTN|nr:hypothetical protein [Actinomadura citrea]GGU02143.1 hypothetical protein GCM10010177_71890 [Actinomadura citrea]
MTLLRRLGNHSRKNRLYRAFRELGRAIRTITLLRYLSESELREQITAITNRTEAFHGFADWLMFGGKLIGHNDPDHQEKVVKFNELIANCVIYSNACDITEAANALAAEGHPVDTDDLATVSPYISHTIRRFGSWTLNRAPPDQTPPPAWTWNPACCSVHRPPDWGLILVPYHHRPLRCGWCQVGSLTSGSRCDVWRRCHPVRSLRGWARRISMAVWAQLPQIQTPGPATSGPRSLQPQKEQARSVVLERPMRRCRR